MDLTNTCFATVAASGALIAYVLAAGCSAAGAEAMRDYPVRPVPFTAVAIEDDFWSRRMATNISSTVPTCFKRCEETGRIRNFAIAGGLAKGKYSGALFNDSDVYKVLEGAAYTLSLRKDPKLDKYVDGVIAKIAAAQEPDGYLSTPRTVIKTGLAKRWGGRYGNDRRWSCLDHGHELYCVGHMYEAAVAHHQATGKRTFLDVAIKNADLICRTFGPKPGQIRNVPGHQEIEIGLVKLYRLTGRKEYLATAKFFLDERGRYNGRKSHGAYAQNHKPVVEQTEPVGHVVRAGYMYCGMADIAALTADAAYVKAIDTIWENIVAKRMYLIGSAGVSDYGEGFGPDYMLPSDRGYNETCATIAIAMLNHRMFMLHQDARYVDVLERSLYNGFLSGVSLQGDTFFYVNPLAHVSTGRVRGRTRSKWFGCACCPSNVCRFMPSVPGYIYAFVDDKLYVNLFVGGSTEVQLAGRSVKLTQKTNYPWDGVVDIGVDPDSPGELAVMVRIPGWARGLPVPSDLYRYLDAGGEAVTLSVNGRAVPLEIRNGYVSIRRRWQGGDRITLKLPMRIRRVLSHEKVKDNAGRVAIERGPIVYCAESVDNGGKALNIVLGDDVRLTAAGRKNLLGGLIVITGTLVGGRKFTAIPYYARSHRRTGQMNVWFRRQP